MFNAQNEHSPNQGSVRSNECATPHSTSQLNVPPNPNSTTPEWNEETELDTEHFLAEKFSSVNIGQSVVDVSSPNNVEESVNDMINSFKKWSNADLAELLEHPELLDMVVTTSPLMQRLHNENDHLAAEIDNLANETIRIEQTVCQIKDNIRNQQHELQNLLSNVESSSASYRKLSEKFLPKNINEALHNSVTTKDEESEKIAELFLQGNLDSDSFVKQYTAQRKISHIRKMKSEKLTNQLKQVEEAGL